ncbi:hypothetical protein PV721_38960 [Streptomyces sp. MB09-01]|uniref:hypothetical protein n=1 Tax=Streptomyces sp. MB09-01 TaxID=3028666 RepID=UPI0029BB4887|nr:hypothetical protein [Streptomyces sp. MB09-01]MDX3540183.1 hypothetical protein [Streptomyces sp. MB09-01]
MALSVTVGIAGEHLGRAVATLLLGCVGALFTFFACAATRCLPAAARPSLRTGHG